MIKNKRKNNIFKLCSLFVMALLCIVSFVVPTKAYYQDESGNLVSDNLLNKSYSSTQSGLTFTLNADTVILDGSFTGNDLYFYTNLFNNLEVGGTYTVKMYTSSNYNLMYDVWLSGNHYYFSATNAFTFTLTTELKNANWRFVVSANTYDNIKFNIMLNSGSTALSYEPYGIYYSQTNYDNNGVIQYGQGYTEGKNTVYDSLTYQNISRLVNNVALAKYDTANDTFINRPNINSVTYEGSDLIVAWSTSSSDNNYWYHLVLSWSTNSIIKDVGFTPSRFSNVILDINGYQMSNVNYNGSYFGFFGINEQYNIPCNTLTLMFKMNRADIFENIHINIQGFNENIQIASEQYNEGYEQGVNVGKAEGYSTGYSEGVNQATQNVIGWKGLFFSMADLPFKTVSNFLGFEVLGVNLFKAFIGFITVLGILWVFKRLVK